MRQRLNPAPSRILALLAAAAMPCSLAAQQAAAQPYHVAPPAIGTDAEERARIAQLLGRDSTSGFLVRSLSSRIALTPADGRLRVVPLAPELDVVTNSTLPFSQNDGPLWAGRGLNARLFGGVAFARGPWRLVVAPELVGTQNQQFRDVDTRSYYRPIIDTERYSSFSSPWMQHPFPMDQPFRPGTRPIGRFDPGQSALWYEGRHVAAGIATENQWWGPGVHDALLFTNNAGGFPHAFVRTARPWRTGVGDFEGRWLVGALSESDWFNFDESDDWRTLAAGAVTYRPRWEPDVTIGVARSVFAATSTPAKALLRWTDVFQPTDRPNARPWSDSSFTGGRDQVTSLFARWVFPDAGFEAYGEIGRAERPASLRDFLVDPTHTMGYVAGGQYVRPWARLEAVWRAQAEFSFLERSSSYRYRPTQSWYSSRATPQGYTQRGQVIGASIGPGSSHQWLALDLIAPSWRVGAFAGRWRLNADHNAIIPYPVGTGWCEYDVTLYPGVRGGYQIKGVGLIMAEAIFGNRLNYLYQNNSGCPNGNSMVDVRNKTIRLIFLATDVR